jgi:amino acid transporter/mannitol/fructose-specific phosphotransferase system IIA component (Ntr-type)
MAVLHKSRRLKKELSLFSVYAIATGTTLSAGFFLLPTYAAERVGPAIILAYVISAALLVPAMLSIVELATAMPRAGGAYYFLDRSLGPLAGTVGGLGTWLALVLKAAFALVGMGAYLALLIGLIAAEYPSLAWLFNLFNFRTIAAMLAVLLGILNLLGAKKTGRFQIILVIGLLAILAWFIAHGSTNVDRTHFEGFFGAGFESIMATAGLVFISYVGVTNVASVSEEVKDPERNLPLGIFLALSTAVAVYVLGIGVMVGVIGAPGLTGLDPPTPVAEAAGRFSSTWGIALVSFAALLAFSSVANAGILSASRYPLAMGRDHLLPPLFHSLSRRGTPKVAISVTVATILLFLLLPDPASIAKLASGFQFLIFGLICLAVIVMRQSGLESYDPGYRAPLYPWLQIIGILAPIWIIAEMGWLPILFTSGMVAVGILWYRGYARKRVDRHGAVYHVFEKLGRRRYPGLDRELRSILKEKGLRAEDPFEEVVARAFVIVGKPRDTFEAIAGRASTLLAQRLPCTSETLVEGFLKGTRIGATPVSGGVALPHLRLPGIDAPQMVLVRCPSGVPVPVGDVLGGAAPAPYDTYAIFFLVSPDKNPGQHLRLLAELAGRVDQEEFISSWLDAEDEQRLKEILLRSDRYLSLPVTGGTATEPLISRPLREVSFPEGCLVAIIRREGGTIVPRGSTVVHEGDWLTVIGSTKGIRELRQQYGADAPPGKSEYAS